MKKLMSGFLRLCGNESVRIKQSVWFGFADGIFESFPFLAVFYLFRRLGSLEWKADRTGCVCDLADLSCRSGRALDHEISGIPFSECRKL